MLNKLVRDNVVALIEIKGQKAIYEVLNKNDYIRELNKKLVEKTNEFVKKNGSEELADIFEVMHAIVLAKNIDTGEVEEIRIKKAAEKGIYKKRIFLKEIE